MSEQCEVERDEPKAPYRRWCKWCRMDVTWSGDWDQHRRLNADRQHADDPEAYGSRAWRKAAASMSMPVADALADAETLRLNSPHTRLPRGAGAERGVRDMSESSREGMDMTHTVTIIGAFKAAGADHVEQTERLADALGAWLQESGFEDLGFTVAPSVGGGSGWPVERGFVVTFADVHVHDVDEWPADAIAEWIRAREEQTAVCVLVRKESFRLVTEPEERRCYCGAPIGTDSDSIEFSFCEEHGQDV